jgi:uncharacterized coiled-coil protein SlyX
MSDDDAYIEKLEEEIETLRARVTELEVINSNQEAMITGHHKYVGQDFKFRIDRLTEQLAASQAETTRLRKALQELHKWEQGSGLEPIITKALNGESDG